MISLINFKQRTFIEQDEEDDLRRRLSEDQVSGSYQPEMNPIEIFCLSWAAVCAFINVVLPIVLTLLYDKNWSGGVVGHRFFDNRMMDKYGSMISNLDGYHAGKYICLCTPLVQIGRGFLLAVVLVFLTEYVWLQI